MNILVIAPYEEKLMSALNDASNVKTNEFILIGCRKTIIELCFKNKFSYLKYKIIDAQTELDVIDIAIKEMKTKTIAYVVFGNISEYYQKKILSLTVKDELKTVNVIDIPHLRHFVFVSNITERATIDFEVKKKMIELSESVMNKLSIKKINVGMVASGNNKTDFLEAKIIRMIFHDNNVNNINVFEVGSIYDLFSQKSKYNVYNANINLIVLRNYDSLKVFIDTLNVFSEAKIANIIAGDMYAIDACKCKDSHDVLFSILVMNKMLKNCHFEEIKKVAN